MKKVSLPLSILLASLAAGPAYANCTSPAGNEADLIYNRNFHTYQFCNGSTWMALGSPSGGAVGLSLISTQTASNSASLQWTGLTGADYLLTCENLIDASASQQSYVQFGEGAGPTWETSNYTAIQVYSYIGSGYQAWKPTLGFDVAFGNNAAPGASLAFYFFALSSSTANKMMVGDSTGYDDADAVFDIYHVAGYYTGDTNPITALRVIAASGNITSGTCILYGMN